MLNVDTGYTHRPEDLRWMPGAREAVLKLNCAGYYVFVVTNQAGVARGYYGEEQVQAFHAHMQDELAEIGAHIDAFYYCPFHEDAAIDAYRAVDHPDRKPNPGMILRAMREWKIDPARSFLIGDKAVRHGGGPARRAAGATVSPAAISALFTGRGPGAGSQRRASRPRPPMADPLDKAVRHWMFEEALPFWAEHGVDRAFGGYVEQLSLDGSDAAVDFKRTRVICRQIYVFSHAALLGHRAAPILLGMATST